MRRKLSGSTAFVGAVLVLTTLVLNATAAQAGTPVYRCVKDGQKTLTDKPCDSGKEQQRIDTAQVDFATTMVPSSTTPSPVGKWWGQIQYQATENGQTIQAAHSVAMASAEFTAEGKVGGASPDNGCKLLGVWSQGMVPTLIWLDVTLDGCRFYRSQSSIYRQFHTFQA